VVVFPNCKINLGLNVTRKRNDGFHDIETVFYPIAFQDALEVIKVDGPKGNIQFSASGGVITGNPEDNLCIKAYRLLKQDFPQLPAMKMHLHKNIPVGAGLGGGSADGAFILKLLNQIYNLGLTQDKLTEYALQLGSDCPFFIINAPCFATGRGELLEPAEPDLSLCKLVIVNPGIHINTTEAFSAINPTIKSKSIKKIIQQPIETWKNELSNDFEEPVFKKYPELNNVKDHLYKVGAIYASMSGSGSSVYGIFEKDKDVRLSFPSSYFIKTIST
jgi:4-diphosphocytidyl-2-C-methyl-D-erythritol kinase